MNARTPTKAEAAAISMDLHADALAAVSLAKSRGETRYYLHGVYVSPWVHEGESGVIMVATNGYILAAYFDAQGTANRPAILSGQFTTGLLKTARSERTPRRVLIEGDVARIMAVAEKKSDAKAVGLMMVQEIDGQFPDWKKIVPSPPTGPGTFRFAWSHIVMSQVLRIAERLNGNQSVAMNAFQASEAAPALFTFGPGCPLSVVAMPVRGGDAERSIGFRSLSGKALASSPPKAALEISTSA